MTRQLCTCDAPIDQCRCRSVATANVEMRDPYGLTPAVNPNPRQAERAAYIKGVRDALHGSAEGEAYYEGWIAARSIHARSWKLSALEYRARRFYPGPDTPRGPLPPVSGITTSATGSEAK